MNNKHCTHICLVIIFVLPLLVINGCSGGPNTAQVTGVITLDGKPLEGAQVRFTPKSRERSSVGNTDANGQYRLRFTEKATGCIPGDHVVRITAYRDPAEEASQYLPAQYNSDAHENEKMNVSVVKGKQEINFDVTSQ